MASFICYRGLSVDNGIGLQIAAQLYELIRDDPCFQPVFFSPEHKDNDFIKDACNFISEADNLFVILSPNFFNGFEKDGKINPESVTYHELRTAFANENCTFRVIRTYGFEWNDSTLESLSKFYPDCELSRLTHRTGLVLKGNAITEPDIVRFRQRTDIGDPTALDRATILEDLDNCVSTVFGARIPLDPESMLSDIFEYQYNNPHKKLLFPDFFRREFKRVSEECKLPAGQFHYWPVDLKTLDQNQPPVVSICAVCFGTLMLHHWLTIDRHNDPNACLEEDILEEIRNTIDGAINLLIALRSPINGSWPASWHFDAVGVDGTINQTTLSLSTLLTCGFLSEELEPEIFKKRYRYIAQSADWLRQAANAYTQRLHTVQGWGHMKENRDNAVLPTAFGVDTLLKFYSCLTTWKSAFSQDADFLKELSDTQYALQGELCNCVRYFRSAFSGIGFHSAGNQSFISIPHTAKVSKSLIRFLRTVPETPDTRSARKLATEMLEASMDFLAGVNTERLFRLHNAEIYESFSYTDPDAAPTAEPSATFQPNSGETFELCGELIHFDAMISYQLYTKALPEALLRSLSDSFRQYRDKRACRLSGRFFVEGHREQYPQHPIYALYYYRMVLEDLFELEDLLNREEK